MGIITSVEVKRREAMRRDLAEARAQAENAKTVASSTGERVLADTVLKLALLIGKLLRRIDDLEERP